jgi:hypothetical protein
MKINYENAVTITISKIFEGETEDGKKFTIFGEWNDWDGWTIDRIEFDESDGTDEEEEQITEQFLNDMN